MSLCIYLLKSLILFSSFRLFNCDYIAKFESVTYDEEKTTETEEYSTQRFTNDIVETKTSSKESVTDENNIDVVCPYFKKSGAVELDSMVGVWRPAYYQVAYKVPCFEMLIRKVTSKEKYHYSQTYGDFNEKIIWDDCNLEIKSNANLVYRKHFLQGCEKGFGVLENIIIEKKDGAPPILIEETADQWLAINNLLMMRDCISEVIVIFSKEDYRPKYNDISEAMNKFGNISKGEWACNDSHRPEKLQSFGGEFESDSDHVFFE